MKEVRRLPLGGQIEFTEDDLVNIVSKNGEVFWFGPDGRFMYRETRKRSVSKEHFSVMAAKEIMVVKNWCENVIPQTERQKVYIRLVKEALEVGPKEFAIANLEPSVDDLGRIYYKEGAPVARGFTCCEWVCKACEFAPEYESNLATKHQLVLWYAYRIAMGFWTIEYVCDDSSSQGNYWYSPNSVHFVEKSGARAVGGAKDGVGNTSKIVVNEDNTYLVFGGYYGDVGNDRPVAAISHFVSTNDTIICGGSGVVVLNKLKAE